MVEKVNDYNQHMLGQKKKKANGDINITVKLDAEIHALAVCRKLLVYLSSGHNIVKTSTGISLKMQRHQFGKLFVDLVELQIDRVRAFDSGNLIFEVPTDHSLYDLLTKHFIKTKQCTPAAVKTFKHLVKLAGLSLHGEKSKKHKLIQGGTIQYYSGPNTLVERLQPLAASKKVGNTGRDAEISVIIDVHRHSSKRICSTIKHVSAGTVVYDGKHATAVERVHVSSVLVFRV